MASADVDFPATVLNTDLAASYELFKLNARANVQAAFAHGAAPGTQVKGIKVVDFGQGDCNEIRTVADQALVYNDMGGGCGKCARTNPSHSDWNGVVGHVPNPAAKLRLGDNPSVILSHWDEDHFYTATQVPAAINLRWLVPRQKIARSHVAFVETLTDIRCWPAAKIRHTFELSPTVKIKVEKCSRAHAGGHYDRNLDGLAVFLVRHQNTAAGLTPDETIVMPGDGPYQCIPSLRDGAGTLPGQIIGTLAFHHGSKTHWTGATDAAMPRVATVFKPHKIVFTYGQDTHGVNNFNLANITSKTKYHARGWLTREDTSGTLAHAPAQPADRGNPPTSRHDREIRFTGY